MVILHLLMNVLRDLDCSGWTLIASADISSKYVHNKDNHFPLDVHSWFFLREGDLNPPPGDVGGAGGFSMPPGYEASAPPAYNYK